MMTSSIRLSSNSSSVRTNQVPPSPLSSRSGSATDIVDMFKFSLGVQRMNLWDW